MTGLDITFLVPSIDVCGGRLHTLEVARRLKNRGHRIRIITPCYDREDLKVFYEDYPVPIIENKGLRTNLTYFPTEKRPLAYAKAAFAHLESVNFWKIVPQDTDVIFAGFYSNIYAAYLAQKKRARKAVTFVSIQNPPYKELKRSYRLAAPVFMRLPKLMDGILTVSGDTRKDIKEDLGLDSFITGNGIDSDIFKPTEDYKELARRLGIPSRSKVLLFLGGIVRRKGIDAMLFPGFKLLKKRYPDLVLVIAGGSRYLEEYKKRAAGLGLSNVIWTGYVKRDQEISKLYCLGDVFVFPSLYESFGLPPLEAMACRRPVVVTDCGGVNEYAVNNKNCLMVPVNDVKKFAEAVSYLLEHPETAKRLGEEGQKAAKEFTWEKVAVRTEEAFLEVIKKHESD
jgi:glycosyltransferase involved in cell wall biosynthesis